MLNPDQRSLYTTALTPPVGYTFDRGLGTTFSLDPTTLLTIPLHLALLGRRDEAELLRDSITLVESLRQVGERLMVFAQRGRLQPPRTTSILYGLLESCIVEVRAPRGGVFHPKLWLLRFTPKEAEGAPRVRLLVLSRNLTSDRSWDLSLQLEGSLDVKKNPKNTPLAKLFDALLGMAVRTPSKNRRDQLRAQVAELGRVQWQLPPGFETLDFHVMGLRGSKKAWFPKASTYMAVISPFCTAVALNQLCETTKNPVALISRPETFLDLDDTTCGRFEECLVLNNTAISEEGEELEYDAVGLHAKMYIAQRNRKTRVYLGSANATSAAFTAGKNVEILVELEGLTSQIGGGIKGLLGAGGMRPMLEIFNSPKIRDPEDETREAVRRVLEEARDQLAQSAWRLECVLDEGCYTLTLAPLAPLVLNGVRVVKAWPITVSSQEGTPLEGLATGQETALGRYAVESVTGLIAIELSSDSASEVLRFALNLTVEGQPRSRDSAILQTVIRNREGFLRYLLLILRGLDGSGFGGGGGGWKGNGGWGSEQGGLPLLEELARAWCRDRDRVRRIGALLADLKDTPGEDGKSAIPTDFLALWTTFEGALRDEEDE